MRCVVNTVFGDVDLTSSSKERSNFIYPHSLAETWDYLSNKRQNLHIYHLNLVA